jgi:hypothetical protein
MSSRAMQPHGEAMAHERTRYDTLLQIRAPEHFTAALDRAVEKRVTNRSDYIRAAVLDRLRADGVEMDQAGAT